MSIKQGGNTIAGSVGQYPLNEKNITNCITYIPQDIKLELNNGTLTLKAGSKVYVPNGAGVFNVITIASDLTTTTNVGGIVFVNSTGTNIYTELLNSVYSGNSAPSSSGIWYDTANNLVKYSSDGQTWSGQYSFPVGIVSTSGGQITSIDQVFNGFGYIGSTVFALPGVEGLMPSGRNADGTLNNTAFTVNNVITKTTSYDFNSRCALIMRDTSIDYVRQEFYLESETTPALKQYARLYQSTENQMYYGEASAWAKISGFNFGSMAIDSSGKITSFSTKTPFRAVDYSDTEYMAHQAMPSNKYIDLTLGASGTTYTAPADGYVTLIKTATNPHQYIEMSTGQVFANMAAIYNGQFLYGTIPVSKGAGFSIGYNAGGSTNRFRFTYANGAQ